MIKGFDKAKVLPEDLKKLVPLIAGMTEAKQNLISATVKMIKKLIATLQQFSRERTMMREIKAEITQMLVKLEQNYITIVDQDR